MLSMQTKHTNLAIRRACDLTGGIASLARSIGVSAPTVHQWITGARPIPVSRCIDIESITSAQVTCEQLRPDVAWHVVREKGQAA